MTDTGKPIKIVKPPTVGDMMFGVLYENKVVIFRIKSEEVSPQGPRRLKLTQEWARVYSELATGLTGSSISSSLIAKRAGRYVCILFAQSSEGENILSILNRDPALDSQENLGKELKVETVFSQGFALGVVTQNKILFWKPGTSLLESNFFQPCQILANIKDIAIDPAHPSQVFALTDASTLVLFSISQARSECQAVAQITLD